VARMIQGFSVGGEYGTAATYMSEVAAAHNRGFLSSFQYVTLVGGQLMASLVLVIHLQLLTKEQMLAWGWRLPFALGALLAIVALYLRSSLHETADLSSHQKEAGTFAELLRHRKALLIVLGYTAGGSLAFYTFTTYMQKYLVNTAKFDKDTATYVMTVVLLVYMVVQPLFGALSDRIGRRNNMFLFCLSGMLMTVPIMTAIGTTKSPLVAFVLATTALMCVSFYTAIAGIVKAELFPTHVRALGVGLSYAIANSLFGGSAEFVALKLKQVGSESAFFWYVTAMLGVALLATIAMPDNRKGSMLEAS
jgi:MFS transporter, MHS family, alpha-ketoglutarate permease